MKKINKYSISLTIVLVTIIIIVFLLMIHIMKQSHHYGFPIGRINATILAYIRANDGEFPSKQEDLIDEGFLRKSINNGKIAFELCPEREGDWFVCPYFEEFKLAYGIEKDDIKIINDSVYEKNVPIMLIDGPGGWAMKGYYRKVSVHLAQEMIDFDNEKGTKVP